jgi:hypothetical protein
MSTARKSVPVLSDADTDERLRRAVREADNVRFIEAWLGWRGPARIMPNRGSLDIAVIADLLDTVILFALDEPDQIRIKVAGTHLRDICDFEGTGRTVAELTPAEMLPLRSYRMRQMASRPCAGAMITLNRQTIGQGVVFESVTLPIEADATGKPHLLITKVTAIGGVFEPPAPGRPKLMPMVDHFDFLDIGAGTPDRTTP